MVKQWSNSGQIVASAEGETGRAAPVGPLVVKQWSNSGQTLIKLGARRPPRLPKGREPKSKISGRAAARPPAAADRPPVVKPFDHLWSRPFHHLRTNRKAAGAIRQRHRGSEGGRRSGRKSALTTCGSGLTACGLTACGLTAGTRAVQSGRKERLLRRAVAVEQRSHGGQTAAAKQQRSNSSGQAAMVKQPRSDSRG